MTVGRVYLLYCIEKLSVAPGDCIPYIPPIPFVNVFNSVGAWYVIVTISCAVRLVVVGGG